jgi:hypothetical protein
MGKFFSEFGNPITKFDFGEIIPDDANGKNTGEKAVYFHYVKGIARQDIDDKLRAYRKKSLVGELEPKDYENLNKILEIAKMDAQHGKIKTPDGKKGSKFYAYARVKSYAMLIAQILFVNNSVKEGLLELIDNALNSKVLKKLSNYIRDCSVRNESPLKKDETVFYATLFILQRAFDRNFVPHENIVQYKKGFGEYTGEYKITHQYKSATLYLNLTNKRVMEASDAEKKLCYNITTGWSKGIDLSTWNELNQYYFQAKSPTTREKNLFTENYDKMLERMLPQFALSRLKCAEEVLKSEYKRDKLKILEIGAGSGAFAIDLLMACKRLNIKTSGIEYVGVEPSRHMRNNFEKNIKEKIDSSRLPGGWKLKHGDLEAFTAKPFELLNNKETVIVFCYCAHHCFDKCLNTFFYSREIQERVKSIYVLDVVKEHGWTKPYYMWADCESPENFDNVLQRGIWHSETLWLEPDVPIEGSAVTNAWCSLRKLTAKPSGNSIGKR